MHETGKQRKDRENDRQIVYTQVARPSYTCVFNILICIKSFLIYWFVFCIFYSNLDKS